MLKKAAIWTSVTQVLIFFSSFVIYKKINLLIYTNISFVFGACLILIAFAGLVVKGRFFDMTFHSFQYFFGRMTDEDRRPLSELAPQNYYYPFISGTVTILLMLITLVLYQVK